MKKITFLLIAFFTLSLCSQEKLTSSINEYFDGSNWVENDKTEYTYDSNDNLIVEEEFYWDQANSLWMLSFKTTNTFNANNKVTVGLYQNYDGNTVDSQYRTLYTYNSNGALTQYIDEAWNGSAWVKTYKLSLIYDEGDKIFSGFSYSWNGNDWYFESQDSQSYTLNYNANGKVSSFKADEWDGANWVNSSQSIFTYNSSSNLVLEEYQTWDGAGWVTESKSENTFDVNGNAILEKGYYFDNGAFELANSETIVFDTSKLMSNYAHPFKDITGIEFLLSGVRIVNKILRRTDEYSRITYNYNEATAGVNDFSFVDFALYPNPATSVLNIDDSNFAIKNVDIYNVLGKKIVTSFKNRINIENLVNGVYVVKVQDYKGNVATKRFVKN